MIYTSAYGAPDAPPDIAPFPAEYDAYADLKYCFKCGENDYTPCKCNSVCESCGLADNACECEVE